MTDEPPPIRPGLWIGASYALGRDVETTEERYPHICGIEIIGRDSGQPVRLIRRDCAACAEKRRPP